MSNEEKNTNAERVKAALTKEPQTALEIAGKVGIDSSKTGALLRQLEQRREARRSGERPGSNGGRASILWVKGTGK